MNINEFEIPTKSDGRNQQQYQQQQYRQQYRPQYQQQHQQYPYPIQRRRYPPNPPKKKKFSSSVLYIVTVTIFLIVTLLNRCTCTCNYNEFSELRGGGGIINDVNFEPSLETADDYESTYVSLRDIYDMIVWLDAGHGGIDGGTSAMLNGIMYLEKDIALDIVLMTYELFNESTSGIKAMLSRSEDVFIHRSERVPLWNDSADLVVSVHIDFYEGVTAPYVYGIQVNFDGNFDEAGNTSRININAEQFAQIMQNHLVQETGARDRQIRGNRNFIICAESTMPALLIETGFMSNQAELALLVTEAYQRQIAVAIYNAIVEAFTFPRV